MGGDPTGERSRPDRMVLVCNWRHKEDHRFSIDKRGIRWEPLTDAGADGPIAWFIDLGKLSNSSIAGGTWVEIAHELKPGELAPLTPQQSEILDFLGTALKIRFN